MKKLMSLIVVAVWTLAFAPAEAGFLVHCPGAQINAALISGETDLIVEGICDERVEVNSDDVTITGHQNGGGIDGALVVFGAQRFKIQNMNVIASMSGLEGIWVTNGASATIDDVMVSGYTECAILVFLNSFAEITNSEIGGGVCGLSVGVGSVVNARTM